LLSKLDDDELKGDDTSLQDRLKGFLS